MMKLRLDDGTYGPTVGLFWLHRNHMGQHSSGLCMKVVCVLRFLVIQDPVTTLTWLWVKDWGIAPWTSRTFRFTPLATSQNIWLGLDTAFSWSNRRDRNSNASLLATVGRPLQQRGPWPTTCINWTYCITLGWMVNIHMYLSFDGLSSFIRSIHFFLLLSHVKAWSCRAPISPNYGQNGTAMPWMNRRCQFKCCIMQNCIPRFYIFPLFFFLFSDVPKVLILVIAIRWWHALFFAPVVAIGKKTPAVMWSTSLPLSWMMMVMIIIIVAIFMLYHSWFWWCWWWLWRRGGGGSTQIFGCGSHVIITHPAVQHLHLWQIWGLDFLG